MNDWQDRTRMLIGQAACETLLKARVAVFGIGGVGGYVCEALVRSGIGTFDLIDNDTVSVSNINRQIIATTKTIGRYKVDVMKERMLEINRPYIPLFFPAGKRRRLSVWPVRLHCGRCGYRNRQAGPG